MEPVRHVLTLEYGAQLDPNVCLDGHDVTSRCSRLTFLPGERVEVVLFVVDADGKVVLKRWQEFRDGDVLHLFSHRAEVEKITVKCDCYEVIVHTPTSTLKWRSSRLQ